MKRTIALFIYTLFPLVVFCNPNDSTELKKWELGVLYSPDFCYRKLKTDAEHQFLVDTRDTLEVGKFGYTIGLNGIYRFDTKFSMESGILFVDRGEKTKQYSLGNLTSATLPIYNTVTNHYYYLDVPVKMNYNVWNGKTKLYVTAGVSANIFIDHKVVSVLEFNINEPEKSISSVDSDLSKLNVAFIAGIGVKHPLSEKAFLYIAPTYKRSIHSIVEAPVKSYLFSIGLNIGITLSL